MRTHPMRLRSPWANSGGLQFAPIRSSPLLRIKLRRAGRILRQTKYKFIKADFLMQSAFFFALKSVDLPA